MIYTTKFNLTSKLNSKKLQQFIKVSQSGRRLGQSIKNQKILSNTFYNKNLVEKCTDFLTNDQITETQA